jgi:hypothetical protein
MPLARRGRSASRFRLHPRRVFHREVAPNGGAMVAKESESRERIGREGLTVESDGGAGTNGPSMGCTDSTSAQERGVRCAGWDRSAACFASRTHALIGLVPLDSGRARDSRGRDAGLGIAEDRALRT